MINKNADYMQKQKLSLQVELNNLLHLPKQDLDRINELKSEILYLDKKIEKIVGKKEIERQNEIKRKKNGLDQINLNNYYNLKSMVKKISPINVATSRMLAVIDKTNNSKLGYEKEMVKS